jgi:hypothetical protein
MQHPEQHLDCRPTERQRPEQLFKTITLLDGYIHEAETGHLLA